MTPRSRLEWRKKPFAELVRLAWPITVSMLSFSVTTLVDTLFVGRLGTAALSGVGLGGVASFAMLCFGFGLLRATKTLVAQATGAANDAAAPRFAGAGLVVALLLGATALALGGLVARALPALASTPDSGALAREYFSVRNIGAPAFLVAVALREARYGLGDSRTGMVASLVAGALHVVLAAAFILVLGLGVAGAAWASAIAHAIEAGVLLVAQVRAGGLARPSLAHVRSLVRIGVPTGLQFVLEVGAFTLLVVLLAGLGDVELAAHQIALQVVHFSFLPAFAIGEAAATLAGQAVGARQEALVLLVARRALGLAVAYTGSCAIVFALAPRFIASAFTSDPALVRVTVHLLWLAAAFQVFDAVNAIARCVLRGTGDVTRPAALAVGITWLTTPPLTWLLGYELGLGALGGWLALTVEIVVAAALLWRRLERGGWHAAARVARDEAEREEGESPRVTGSARA